MELRLDLPFERLRLLARLLRDLERDLLRKRPSPSDDFPLEPLLELRRDLRLRASPSSSNSRRLRELRLSRYRERRATAKAKKVAMKRRNENVRKAFAKSLDMGDSSDFEAFSLAPW